MRSFRYKYNISNLFGGVFLLGAIALIVYGWRFSEVDPSGYKLLFLVGYSVLVIFLLWLAVYYLKTFVKLRGQERLVIIDDQSVTFPEHGDSLNVIRLNFSEIRDIYFGKDRHGRPGNLIVKYGLDGHAYIQRDALARHEFEQICELFKQHLKLNEIELR